MKINSQKVDCETSGEGYRFIYPLGNGSEIVKISIGDNEYQYAHQGYKNLTNFVTSGSTITTSSESSFINNGDGTVDFDVISVTGETINQTIKFTPYIMFDNINLSGVKKLLFKYSNPSTTEDLLFDVDLMAKGKTSNVGGHFCIKGGKKEFEIDLSSRNLDLSKYNSIRIRFSNYYSDDNDNIIVYNARNICFEDIIGIY